MPVAAPAVRVGQCHSAWTRLGASPWLVRQLRFGLQLPWLRQVPYMSPKEYPMSSTAAAFASQEVARWLALGFVRRPTAAERALLLKTGQIYPSFVADTAGKNRLVIDYKRANACLEPRTFRMDQLYDLSPELLRNDNLFKADLTDGYYHLRLRPADGLRLSFFVGGDVFIPLCLNCGLSVAPWFFTKAMAPIVAFLRRLGHRVFSYIDDFFGAAKPASKGQPTGRAETRGLGRLMSILFTKLGLTLKPEKCVFDGRTRLEILGILVDTTAAQFLLPPTKVSKIERAARALLTYATRHRRYVRRREVQRFAGLANATSPAVVDCRLRLRELFDALSPSSTALPLSAKSKDEPFPGAPSAPANRLGGPANYHQQRFRGRAGGSLRADVKLTHAGMRDLQWWARIGSNPHVGRAIWPQPTACVFTDASMSGWGAAWDGRVPASGFFGEEHEGAHINELELSAALLALETFLPFARKRHVQLVTDSLVTMHIVRNYTSRSPRLLAKLRRLRALCEAHGITLSTRHLPSVLNCWADRLSRRRDTPDWGLSSDARRLLQRRFAKPLFYVDGNALPARMPPAAFLPLVAPRPSLLGVWTRCLVRRGGVLVAPDWPRQQWFQSARARTDPVPLKQAYTPPWRSVLFSFAPPPAIVGGPKALRLL